MTDLARDRRDEGSGTGATGADQVGDAADRASADGLSPDAGAGATGADPAESADTALAGSEGLDPPVREIVGALEQVTRDVRHLVAPLCDAQLNWRPSDERWSIAECVAHLVASGNVYVGPIARAIERGMARQVYGGADFTPTRIGRWFIAEMEPPPRRRLPTLRRLVPRGLWHRDQLLADFEAMQRSLIHRAIAANGLDLGRIRMRSPLVPVVRLPLGTWFAFLAAHERRHLWQARQVREEEGFPR